MEFMKYHGLGNDYLVYDVQRNGKGLSKSQVKAICHRHFGIGSDGILYGPIMDGDSLQVRIWNPDGSEAEKSGNGVRIFAKYLKDYGYVTKDKFLLSTLGGDVEIEYLNKDGSLIKALMGKPTFDSERVPVAGPKREVVNEAMTFHGKEYQVTCVSIGNPHCVIPMEDFTEETALELGPHVERSKNFPNRINMQLLQVMDRRNVKIEIYERGAGYTLASGSSSCAAAAAAYKLNLIDDVVDVHMPGGILKIEILSDESVYMTGEVKTVGRMILSEEFLQGVPND